MTRVDRRFVLSAALGASGLGLTSKNALARGTKTSSIESLYGKAVVIDGNVMAPIDPTAHLDAETTREVRASGLTALKMTLGGSGNQSKAETIKTIAAMDRGIAASGDLYIKVGSSADITAAKRTGRIGVIYSFEAAEMLEGKLESIDEFRSLGVLVMGLSYNVATPFASGVLTPRPTGLTPLGRRAVERMNEIGVTIDLSHSDEASSGAAIAASRQPVVITHAGCDAVHRNPRNKSDALLRALADRGGVVGIYDLSFLTEPPRQPTLEDYLAHLQHALNICGEDHVGIGSDTLLTKFDTSQASLAEFAGEVARRKAAGVSAPGEGPPPFVTGLNRSDRCEIIAASLLKRGCRTRVVEKVLGANFQRVFDKTWRST